MRGGGGGGEGLGRPGESVLYLRGFLIRRKWSCKRREERTDGRGKREEINGEEGGKLWRSWTEPVTYTRCLQRCFLWALKEQVLVDFTDSQDLKSRLCCGGDLGNTGVTVDVLVKDWTSQCFNMGMYASVLLTVDFLILLFSPLPVGGGSNPLVCTAWSAHNQIQLTVEGYAHV